MEREALSLAMDGLERILGSFEKDGKVVMKSMIRNELFAEMHLLLKKAKKALAQPEQENKHIVQSNGRHSSLLTHMMNKRTTPPKREWVELTDEEKADLVHELFAPCSKEANDVLYRLTTYYANNALYLLTAHYNKLKEKNT